jgi:hypothetical protein
MNAGDTFFIHALGDDHLWMIVSDPQLNPDAVVVCFLTWTEGLDDSCIVRVGEHPFVKHDTCVHFAGARLVAVDRLTELKRIGHLKVSQPLSADLLNRIRSAAENSDMPSGPFDLLRRQGLVGP